MWGRRLWSGLAAGSVLLLVMPVWAHMRADYLASIQPELALQVNPQHVGARIQLAIQALQRDDHQAAETAALPLLALRPLENQPYRILAAAYEATGRDAMAVAAHQAAISLSPRSAPSRLWLASRDLQRGRFEAALTHLDWALRVQPDTRGVVFPRLSAGLAHAEFREPLVAVLKTNPSWRAGFLGQLAQQGASLDAALEVVLELADSTGLSDPEKQVWLARLEREQRWEAYQRLDPSRARVDEAAEPVLLVDGEFENAATGMGSGWRLTRIAGATVTLSGNSGRPSGGRALTIEFSRQRVPFDHVRQLLRLPAGKYRVVGQARLDDLQARRGLRWLVACERSSKLLGASPHFLGSQLWEEWAFDVQVPEDCETQWLALRLDARGPSESMISGIARFDALAIEQVVRSDDPSPSPTQ